MSPKTQNAIALFCYSWVCHHFAMFCNPLYRGPKFTWDRFTDMMADQCKNMLFVHVVYPKRQQDECEKHAAKTGHEIAAKMVKWMTES